MRFKINAGWVLLSLLLAACGKNPFSQDALFALSPLPLSHLPVDKSAVLWIQHYGSVNYGDERGTWFHPGIDIGTVNEGKFIAAGDGIVTNIVLNDRSGGPGNGYRILIDIGCGVFLDYHFEVYANYPDEVIHNAIKVSRGQRVKAGQLIGVMLVASGLGQVDFSVNHNDKRICPKKYFTPKAAKEFEDFYNSGIEKRGSSGPYLF